MFLPNWLALRSGSFSFRFRFGRRSSSSFIDWINEDIMSVWFKLFDVEKSKKEKCREKNNDDGTNRDKEAYSKKRRKRHVWQHLYSYVWSTISSAAVGHWLIDFSMRKAYHLEPTRSSSVIITIFNSSIWNGNYKRHRIISSHRRYPCLRSGLAAGD